jgi:DNA-binding LacI/PurR family transcriptional regulator
MAKITQADIAKSLGVSQTAVSAVLNNNPSIKLSEETRLRILEFTEQQGYQLNKRNSSRLRSGLIGVLNFVSGSQVGQAKVWESVTLLEKLGFRPVVWEFFWFVHNAEEVCQSILDSRVEGLILVGLSDNFPSSVLRKLIKVRLPIVAIEGIRIDGISRVQVDKEEGFHSLAQHLILQGKLRIALVLCWCTIHRDAQHSPHLVSAEKGVLRAFEEAGNPRENLTVYREEETAFEGLNRFLLGKLAMDRILDQGGSFDAIIFTNDSWATGALRACHSRGIKVPEQLAIVGFDDEDISAYTTPSLTTCAQPVDQIARLAVNHLLKLKKAPLKDRISETITLAPQLVVRDSCGGLQKYNSPALVSNNSQ